MYSKVLNKEELAESLADLTCKLARSCMDKELYFADQYNLTSAEFRLLRYFRYRDNISIKELGELMDLTPGRITHILTTLEKKNYVRREMDHDDRRGINVCLMETAHPFIREINENHVKLHSEILEFAPENKRDLIVEAMQELVDALQHWRNSK